MRDEFGCTPLMTLLSEKLASVEYLRQRFDWLVGRGASYLPFDPRWWQTGTGDAVGENEEFQPSRHGLDAVVDVCLGDARQAVNLLQSPSLGDATTAANSGDDNAVYESCGLPSPSEICMILDALLSLCFSVAHEALSCFVCEKQFSLEHNSAASRRILFFHRF